MKNHFGKTVTISFDVLETVIGLDERFQVAFIALVAVGIPPDEAFTLIAEKVQEVHDRKEAKK